MGGRLFGAACRRHWTRRAARPRRALAALLLASAAGPGALAALDCEAPASAADGAPPGLADRVERAARSLLGARYVLGPLGEGAPPDEDPRFRLDAFDCTTYVETVLALGLAGEDAATAVEATTLPLLDRVRYRGGVARFESRRHLIDAQWIPQLVEEGLLRDVTRAIGGRAARTQVLRLRRELRERSRRRGELELPWSVLPLGRHDLPYLPWSALENAAVRRALPHAAILSLVATPSRDTPTLVTHQAILFRVGQDDLVVRHASTRHRRVVEESLDAFAARARARRSRTVVGVNVLAIVPEAWPRP